jgi:hypothetical protein
VNVATFSRAGVRKGELLALRVEEVDSKAQEVHVAFAIADRCPGCRFRA